MKKTNSGKALMAYLRNLGVLVEKNLNTKRGSLAKSKEDIQKGRIEEFSSSKELFDSLGI